MSRCVKSSEEEAVCRNSYKSIKKGNSSAPVFLLCTVQKKS